MSSSLYAGDVSDDDKQPRKRLDKGKGKMKTMPELPEDVWRRVFQLWYDDACEGWQSTGQMVDGVTPLLISRSTSQVATAVLYAHPHISEGRLQQFIDNVQTPCSYLSLESKVSLVHHLTVRPTPIRERNQEELPYRGEKQLVDSSLPHLTRLFPTLKSFVLRDCLIQTQADAITLFTSLAHMNPQKARLEIRMWSLSDDPVGRDLKLATNFGTHGFSRPNPDRSTGPYGGGAQMEWRDAVYADRDMELPRYWLEPEVIHGAANVVATAAINAATIAGFNPAQVPLPPDLQPAMAIIDIAAPLSLFDPQNPTGPRLQIPVANMSPLGRAIELCRDVYRTDFARTSVPTDNELGEELVRMGRFHLQMTRQDAASVLRRLGHHPPVNAPEVTDLELVKRANLWANSARELAVQAARQGNRASGTSNNNAPRSSSDVVPIADEIRRDVQEEKARRIRRRADLHARRAIALAGRTGNPNPLGTNLGDDSRYAPSYVGRHDNNEEDEAGFQEALRESRQHAEMPEREGQASSSMLPPRIADDNISHSASAAIPVTSTSQNDANSRVIPSGTHEPSKAIRRRIPIDTGSEETDSDSEVNSRDRLYAADVYTDMVFAEGTFTGDLSRIGTMSSQISQAMGERQQGGGSRWPGTEANARQTAVIGIPQRVTSDYHAENAIGPGDSSSILVDDMLPRDRSLRSQHLACAMRKQLLHLIENTWSPKLQAFSLVTLDPLAALIALAPELDLWIHVAVPHIRVQLPRGVNSLSIFKGTREHTRDRNRAAMLNLRAAQDQVLGGLFGAVVGANANTNQHTRDLRNRYPLEQVIDPIVGGDGSGGGLVHPETRLFEVEVNTVREMTDESWYLAGSELPPQVCRILTGAQDWSEVGLRANVETRQEDVGFPSPKTDDYASPQYYGSDGMFDSNDEGSMDGFELDGDESAGEGYDAEAARAQAERIVQRKRDRAAQDTAE